MKFSFKSKLFFAFIVYGLSLVLLAQLAIFKISEMNLKSTSIEKASEVFKEKNKLFELYIRDTHLKILSIINSDIFNRYLNDTKNINLASSLFLDITNTSDNIMQLRYIDNDGMEIIRVDRDEFSSKAYLIDAKNLQNKSNRYYFKDISNIPKGKFWYSKLDLNIEHGKIEKPLKPVLRIGTPLFHKGKKEGILIINIFMKNFLHELTNSSLYNIYIYNKEGKVLIESMHTHIWNQYMDNNNTLSTHIGKESTQIIYNKEYYGTELYSNKMFLNNNENLHMIIKPKVDQIQKEISKNLHQLQWIMLGVILLSFPFSYFFSKTPAKQKEKADQQTMEQDVLLSLFDLSDAVLFKWNNDEHWSVNSVSQSVEKLLGHTQDDFQNNIIAYDSCIHHDDLKGVIQEVTDAIDNKVYHFEHKPYRIVTKVGNIKWILDSTVIVRDKNDTIINFVGYLTDITALKNSEIKLKKLSITDQLTKIFNRMHTDDTLQNQYYRFYRDNEKTSVILIDIDFFKSVNDKYGHLVGDSVLIEFASLLKSSIREGDVLGRWGGEEFLIILPHTDLTQAMQLSQKLRQTIYEHVFSTINHKTASFGVATFEKGMSVENLIESADKSLYLSKENGRNCVIAIQLSSK